MQNLFFYKLKLLVNAQICLTNFLLNHSNFYLEHEQPNQNI